MFAIRTGATFSRLFFSTNIAVVVVVVATVTAYGTQFGATQMYVMVIIIANRVDKKKTNQ